MNGEPVTLCALGDEAAGEGTGLAPVPLRARLAQIRRGFRQLFGIPDFERYCEHLRAKHPGTPMPSEREFHAMAIDRRYGAGRPRCC